MSGDRRPEEVAVVVRRPGKRGTEFLVVLRSPEKLGYWHLVAGGVDGDEDAGAAAARELREETGLDAEPSPRRPARLRPRRRPRVGAGALRGRDRAIVVWPFVADAPPGWEPVLDEEHVDHRWLDADDAVELLHYPEPREAVRRAAAS